MLHRAGFNCKTTMGTGWLHAGTRRSGSSLPSSPDQYPPVNDMYSSVIVLYEDVRGRGIASSVLWPRQWRFSCGCRSEMTISHCSQASPCILCMKSKPPPPLFLSLGPLLEDMQVN